MGRSPEERADEGEQENLGRAGKGRVLYFRFLSTLAQQQATALAAATATGRCMYSDLESYVSLKCQSSSSFLTHESSDSSSIILATDNSSLHVPAPPLASCDTQSLDSSSPSILLLLSFTGVISSHPNRPSPDVSSSHVHFLFQNFIPRSKDAVPG